MVRREAQMAAKEGRVPVYDNPQATDELLGFLVAGHDTTATSVMWIVKYLTEFPQVQTRLRNDLYAAHPSFAADNMMPTVEAITTTQVPYLDAVIDEVLRLAMTTQGASRRTIRDVNLLGHHVPEGVDLQILCVGSGYVKSNAINNTIPEKVRSPSSQEHKGRLGVWDDADMSSSTPTGG